MDRLTEQVDNAVDVAEFLKCSEKGIYKEKEKCDEAMDANDILTALNSAGNMAKRAERIVVAGKREMDNTDDPVYVSNVPAPVLDIVIYLKICLVTVEDQFDEIKWDHSTNGQCHSGLCPVTWCGPTSKRSCQKLVVTVMADSFK